MRASKAMQHRVSATKNLEVLYHTEVDEVLGDQVVEGLRMINNETGEKKNCHYRIFSWLLGIKPNTEIFKGQIDMDDTGYIITKGKSTKTNKPGVLPVGCSG